MPSGFRRDDGAITPIIGTIFVLAITVAGMGIVLFLGGPVIQRLQDEGALRQVAGQFETARHDLSTLSIPQTAKAPGITSAGGTLGIDVGDWLMITEDQDSAFPSCDFHVTGWYPTGTSNAQLTFTLTSVGPPATTCRVPDLTGCHLVSPPLVPLTACLEAYRISGSTKTPVAFTGVSLGTTATGTIVGGLGTSDWLFELNNGGSTVYAQAWILHQDRLHWVRESGVGGAEATLESGTIFLAARSQAYLDAPQFIVESSLAVSSGIPPYLLRVPQMISAAHGGISGSDSHSVLLQLSSNTLRAQTTTATRLRYDIAGPLARAWCDSFVLRNGLQTLPTFTGGQFAYVADTNLPCAASGANAVRSVSYCPVATAALTTCLPAVVGTSVFPFAFSHAQVAATLQV